MENIEHPPSPFILVTGGAGFIGSHLVERLLADGNTVVVIDDFSTGSSGNLRAAASNPNLRVIESRISTCSELPELAAGARAIYHLAAAVGVELVVKSPIHTLETNLHETEVLLKAAAENRTPVLLASTSEVYGKSEKPLFSEDDDLLIGPPNRSRWGYACSKLMDEFLALAYAQEKSLPVTIARLFNTVGPRQTGRYGMVLPRFIAAAKRGQPLIVYGDGLQSRCFCFVKDTVEALVRLQNCLANAATSSPSPPRSGGLELLGKQRKESAEGGGPLRAEGAGASESLGRGEAALEVQGKTICPVRGEVFNIGSTEEISILDLARLVVKTLGAKSDIELIPYDQAYTPGFEDMRRRKPRIEKLAAAVGFRPTTTLREIIRQTADALPAS